MRAAQDFDAFYADRLREPEVTDNLVVLSFDGKGIAMRQADLREATRKAAEAEPKLHTRLAKGEKPNRKRMAQVVTAAAAPVEKAATYLVKHMRLLHYDRALAEGLPIATGVIEGACRYLVQDRLGRTGARRSLNGAEAILRLRALRASGDFDDYWQFHLAKDHERTHRSRYADGAIPNPLPPKPPVLRLVK